MPSHPSSLPGPLVAVPAVSLLVFSLLINGLLVDHRRPIPLPYSAVCRISPSLCRSLYWSQRVGLRTYHSVALLKALPCEAACGTFSFRFRLEAYSFLRTWGMQAAARWSGDYGARFSTQ